MTLATVHFLLAGRALCGLAGTPNTWPDGQAWVSIDTYQAGLCEACRAAFLERMGSAFDGIFANRRLRHSEDR